MVAVFPPECILSEPVRRVPGRRTISGPGIHNLLPGRCVEHTVTVAAGVVNSLHPGGGPCAACNAAATICGGVQWISCCRICVLH